MNRYLVFFFLFRSMVGFCQQVPYIHQYQINPFIYNPAAAGSTDYIQTFFIRNQKFVGFDGGNISNVLTADGKFFSDKMGFGLSLFNDNIGLLSSVGGSLAYSYKVQFSEKTKLSFGLSAGAADKRFNFSSAIVQDPNDPVLDPTNTSRKTILDLNAGILLDAGDLRFGFSVPQLIGTKVKFGNDAEFSDARHFIGLLSYRIFLSRKLEMTLAPVIQVKYIPGAPFQFDAGLNFDVSRFGWFMVSYNSNYGISGNLGVRIKKNLMLGYAYDYVINSTSAYNPFNQEILVGYRFGQTSDDKSKKLLEEAMKENERLKLELQKKTNQLDSLYKEKERVEEQLRNEMTEKARQYEDTIRMLREEIDRLKKQPAEVKETVVDPNEPKIKKSDNDHFLELDMSTESPNGYYVIYGAFGKLGGAEQRLNELKTDFPEARIIYNERNQLHYVLLTYSGDKPKVFGVHRTAQSKGMKKAWILEY